MTSSLSGHEGSPARDCILCNIQGRAQDPRCPYCREPEPLLPREKDEDEEFLPRWKEQIARDTWAACFNQLGGEEIVRRYTEQEELDAYSAILIIARTTKIPLVFMDPSDAGGDPRVSKIGMGVYQGPLRPV